MYDWAVGKVRSVGHDIAQGIRDALGIKSPSTVFAEIGRNVVAGFVQGITGSMGAAHAAVGGLMGAGGAWMGGSGPRAGAAYLGSAYAGAAGGPAMVETTVMLDGAPLVRALTPATQRRRSRSGTSGMS
jgi:hypothetical protein